MFRLPSNESSFIPSCRVKLRGKRRRTGGKVARKSLLVGRGREGPAWRSSGRICYTLPKRVICWDLLVSERNLKDLRKLGNEPERQVSSFRFCSFVGNELFTKRLKKLQLYTLSYSLSNNNRECFGWITPH